MQIPDGRELSPGSLAILSSEGKGGRAQVKKDEILWAKNVRIFHYESGQRVEVMMESLSWEMKNRTIHCAGNPSLVDSA